MPLVLGAKYVVLRLVTPKVGVREVAKAAPAGQPFLRALDHTRLIST